MKMKRKVEKKKMVMLKRISVRMPYRITSLDSLVFCAFTDCGTIQSI